MERNTSVTLLRCKVKLDKTPALVHVLTIRTVYYVMGIAHTPSSRLRADGETCAGNLGCSYRMRLYMTLKSLE